MDFLLNFQLANIKTPLAISAYTISVLSIHVLSKLKINNSLCQKDNKFVQINSIPKEVSSRTSLQTSSLSEEIQDIIEEFIGIAGDLGIDLTSLYAHFREYNIVIKEDAPSNFSFQYDLQSGLIEVSKSNLREGLIGALLHLSSTRIFNDVYATGFFRKIGEDDNIGEGLLVGYTYLLGIRYFGYQSEYINIQTITAYIIEFIVGQDVMEKAFFEASLDTILKELSKYSDETTALRIIRQLDHLLEAICCKSLIIETASEKTYRFMMMDIAKMLIKKLSLIVDDTHQVYKGVEGLNYVFSSVFNGGRLDYSLTIKQKNEIIKLISNSPLIDICEIEIKKKRNNR